MVFERARFLAVPLLLLGSIAAEAQYQQPYQRNPNRNDYYNGVRQGGRGGSYGGDRYNNNQYNNDRYNNDRYNNDRYRDRNQGGIGPGKGALIGGAGGAALGAIFGGGLKGTIIGGAAGAGIGAVVGKVHQNNTRKNNDYYRPR